MDLQQEYVSWDWHNKNNNNSNNQKYANGTVWHNHPHKKVLHRSWPDFRPGCSSDFILNSFGLPVDSQVLKQNSWKIMQKLNEFQTVEEFFAWMKQRFQLQITNEEFCYRSYPMQETYPNYDYYSEKDQDSRSHHRGVQSGFSDKVSYNSKQDLTFNEAYTCSNACNEFKDVYNHSQLSSVNVNNTNYKYDFTPKYQYQFKGSEKDLTGKKKSDVFSDINKQRDCTHDNLRTGGQENRKQKYVPKKIEDSNFTSNKSDDIPLNLSKNASQTDSTVSTSVEDECIHFAPYDDCESDIEYIDEDSLFAKHQREYYRSSESKRLKTSHGKEHGSKNLVIDNYLDALVKYSSSEMATKASDERHVLKSFCTNDNVEESVADSYFCEVSQQEEAIDYSVKLNNKSNSDSEITGKNRLEDNCKRLSSNSPEKATEYLPYVSEPSFKHCDKVKGVKDLSVKCTSGKRRYSPKQVTFRKSGKNLASTWRKKIGYVNSIAKLGFCFPLAQDKVTSLLKKKSVEGGDFHKVAPIYKTLSREWFETLLKECMRSLNEKVFEGDSEKGEILCGKQKKTLENVLDTLITDMMEKEDDI